MTETPRNWPAYYRDLTTHELIARTYSLRIAAKWGHALEQAERFAALEAEQDRRCVADVATARVFAGREAAAEPFTVDEVRAEEALDAYMAGDPNA